MKPEDQAREEIDRQLTECGWVVQDQASMNIMVAPGVAVREFKLKTGHGRADYLLYAEGKVIGVIEAKPAGYTLTGVEAQDYIIDVLTEARFAEVVDPLTALTVSQNVAADEMAAGPGDILALAHEVFDPSRTREPHQLVPSHGADGPGHVAFAVPAEELDAWREHLAAHGVEIEQEVDWSEGRSIYFRDPADNSVELAPPTLWGMG